MPVSEVSSADVLEILTPLWHRKAATAKRVRQRLRAVLEWAVAMEYRLDNPCDRIGPVLGPQKDVTEHMRALPHGEVAAAIRTVWASAAPCRPPSWPLSSLVLTAARWSEVRWAEWAEIDRNGEGVDHSGQADEDEPPPPGAAVWTAPWRFSTLRRHWRG